MNSPQGTWIALEQFSGTGDSAPLRLTALRSGLQISATTLIQGVTYWRYDQPYWLNDNQIVLALAPEADQYRWIVWSPSTGEQETIILHIPDIGNAVEANNVPPRLDPKLQLVAYPCTACGADQYRVRDIRTGNVVWTINNGPDIDPSGLPVWSPDGAYLAVAGFRDAHPNGLWIYSRQGQVIYQYALPDPAEFFSVGNKAWSPNSKYLAFIRATPDAVSRSRLSLAIVSMADGRISDVCVGGDEPIWSPTSDTIALTTSPQDPGQPYLSLVDVASGAVTQLADPIGISVRGWVAQSAP